MGSSLHLIARARIPWLLDAGIEESGRAQIVTDFGTVPARFTETDNGALAAAFRAAPGSAHPEVMAYAALAARACEYTQEFTAEGDLWLRTTLPADGRVVQGVAEFVRTARSTAAACAWLEADGIARTCQSAWAADHTGKGANDIDRGI